jgi:hypothetical protein
MARTPETSIAEAEPLEVAPLDTAAVEAGPVKAGTAAAGRTTAAEGETYVAGMDGTDRSPPHTALRRVVPAWSLMR